MTEVIENRVLDPNSVEDRQQVRQALVHHINQLTSEEIVDLMLKLVETDDDCL
jgi:nitric oxide synthase oxygenase domain/subunit